VARIPDKVQLVGNGTDEEMKLCHFYLTLLSNASMKLYLNYTAAQYTIELPCPISLGGGDWEFALTELSVRAIFDSVVRDLCYVKLVSHEHTINNPTSFYTIAAEHYNDDSLLRCFNYHIANEGILYVLFLTMLNGKVELLNSSNFKAR